MDNNEIKNWPKLLYDELPSIVKPLFSLSVFLIIFLIIGNNLKLNDSLWSITKEGVFNLAFCLGIFSLVFRALNKAPLEFRKSFFSRKYSKDKLNVDYFLGQYDGFDKVFVFELNKRSKKKFWIQNLPTKRQVWPGVNSIPLKIDDKNIEVSGKNVDLKHYKSGQDYDGKIDIINPGQKDNLILIAISIVIIVVILQIF